jgi:hypothetical protein
LFSAFSLNFHPYYSRRLNGGVTMIDDVARGAVTSARPWPARQFEPPSPNPNWSLSVLLIDDDVADAGLILSVLKRHPQVSAAPRHRRARVASHEETDG